MAEELSIVVCQQGFCDIQLPKVAANNVFPFDLEPLMSVHVRLPLCVCVP